MKPLRSSLILFGTMISAGVCAQNAPPAPQVPPVPLTPSASPLSTQPPMRSYRYVAPIGIQGGYMFEVLRTNKDELKLSDTQWKAIQDARDADMKARADRSTRTITIRQDLQALADADQPDVAKIEAKVRELKKAEGDDMMADFTLTALYRKTLTAEQRQMVKTMAPKFEPYMPVPARPGMPYGPSLMPGGTPPGAIGTPGGPPAMPPVPKDTAPRP